MTLPPASRISFVACVAAQLGQGAGEHERLALERAALGAALGLGELEAQAALAQARDQLEDRLVGELLAQRLGEHRPDPLDLGDRLGVGLEQARRSSRSARRSRSR